MLLRRYNDIKYILNMGVFEFLQFYNLAKEKERDDRIFTQWAAQLPFMSKDGYVSFEDYKARVTGKNIDRRSTAEILAEVDEIERKFERG